MADFDEYSDDSQSDGDYASNNNSTENNNNNSTVEQKVLSTAEVCAIMDEEIRKVCDISGLLPSKTRSLLNSFKWDSSKLLEDIFEGGKKTQELTKIDWKVVPCHIRNAFDCQICFETFTNPKNMKMFPCNHRFCNLCLVDYISTIIKDQGGTIVSAIKCPGHDCVFELEDATIMSVITDVSLQSRYQWIIANSFVKQNRAMKWCPSAHCQNAVILEAGGIASLQESVRCSCGFYFCFHCHGMSHDPISCKMLQDWILIQRDDLEAQRWILENTKPCPACKVNIEKNGGCMHMTCRTCKYEFCWMCADKWNHNGHNCRNAGVVTKTDGSEYFRRFSPYHIKHETMKQAYLIDAKNYKSFLKIGVKLELPDQLINVDFLARAVEILLESRRTLMHSYIFSFMMTTIDNQMYIFEENLKYLERCTEQLSEILENKVTAQNVDTHKHKIIDNTSLCAKRRRDLIDHIIEGYDKNWWRKFPIPPEELIAVDDEAIQNLLY